MIVDCELLRCLSLAPPARVERATFGLGIGAYSVKAGKFGEHEISEKGAFCAETLYRRECNGRVVLPPNERTIGEEKAGCAMTCANGHGADGGQLDAGHLAYIEGPEIGSAVELLGQFIHAFGLEKATRAQVADEKAPKRAMRGLSTEASSVAVHQKERLMVAPTLRNLAPKLAEIRAVLDTRGALLPNASAIERYQYLREEVAEHWNAALADLGLVTIPPLCSVCQIPVLTKAPSFLRGGPRISTVCSETCRDTAKKRNRRRR